MRSQLGLRVRRVGVRIARAGQDGGDVDASMEALFAESEALQRRQIIFFCRATTALVSVSVVACFCPLERGN